MNKDKCRCYCHEVAKQAREYEHVDHRYCAYYIPLPYPEEKSKYLHPIEELREWDKPREVKNLMAQTITKLEELSQEKPDLSLDHAYESGVQAERQRIIELVEKEMARYTNLANRRNNTDEFAARAWDCVAALGQLSASLNKESA